jgi:hypothetical protein
VEIADQKVEIADFRVEIADRKVEIADLVYNESGSFLEQIDEISRLKLFKT